MAYTINKDASLYKICPKCRGIGYKDKVWIERFLFIFADVKRERIWTCSRCNGSGSIYPKKIIDRVDDIGKMAIY